MIIPPVKHTHLLENIQELHQTGPYKSYGWPLAAVQKMFAMDALLGLLAHEQPDSWRLHGSALLAARRTIGARVPKDLDLECLDAENPFDAVDLLKRTIGDSRFELLEIHYVKNIEERVVSINGQVQVTVHKKNFQFSCDIRQASSLGREQSEAVGPMTDMNAIGWPVIPYQAVPLHVQFAEKIAGMVVPDNPRRRDVGSGRHKDAMDLVAMLHTFQLPLDPVHKALERLRVEQPSLPTSYVPNGENPAFTATYRTDWKKGVEKNAAKSPLALNTCAEVEAFIAPVVDALLSGAVDKTYWSPVSHSLIEMTTPMQYGSVHIDDLRRGGDGLSLRQEAV